MSKSIKSDTIEDFESSGSGEFAIINRSNVAAVTDCVWTSDECVKLLESNPMHTLARYRLA